MPEEDWEMVPHKILADLRDEVQALKEKIAQPEAPSKELGNAITTLQSSIKQLLDIFSTALTNIKEEPNAQQELRILIQSLNGRLSNLERQNEQIAKALIAFSGILDDVKRHEAEPRPMNMPMGMQQGMLYTQPRMPPRQQPMQRPQQMQQRPAPFPMPSSAPSPFEHEELPMSNTPEFSQRIPSPPSDLPPPPPMAQPRQEKGLFGKIFGR